MMLFPNVKVAVLCEVSEMLMLSLVLVCFFCAALIGLNLRAIQQETLSQRLVPVPVQAKRGRVVR